MKLLSSHAHPHTNSNSYHFLFLNSSNFNRLHRATNKSLYTGIYIIRHVPLVDFSCSVVFNFIFAAMNLRLLGTLNCSAIIKNQYVSTKYSLLDDQT